ncbi:MAG: hypothetical protein AB7K68_11630 [Bacteriovoracia bacterium]
MKKLSLVLALCAFIAAPAFANEHGGATAAADATASNETAKAPAKHGKTKGKKAKGKMHSEKAAPAAHEEHEEAAHQ